MLDIHPSPHRGLPRWQVALQRLHGRPLHQAHQRRSSIDGYQPTAVTGGCIGIRDYGRRLPHIDPGSHSLWIASGAMQDITTAYRFEPKCFYCPSTAWDLIKSNFKDNQWSLVSGGPKVRFGYIHLSYRKAYNGTLHGDVLLLRKLTEVPNPGETPYYVDFVSPNNQEVYSHRTGGNILMLDGRCVWRNQPDATLRYSRAGDVMMPQTDFYW